MYDVITFPKKVLKNMGFLKTTNKVVYYSLIIHDSILFKAIYMLQSVEAHGHCNIFIFGCSLLELVLLLFMIMKFVLFLQKIFAFQKQISHKINFLLDYQELRKFFDVLISEIFTMFVLLIK